MGQRRIIAIALLALVIGAGGWALWRTGSAPGAVGDGTCPLATLPPQAADTVAAIHSDGPFPFPRNDGVVFGNREGHLPDQGRGYYREYTVLTAGAPNRGTRRIVTGGTPRRDPPQFFYTDDHYDSFCLITDAGRR